MLTIRRSAERGHANHGWLDSFHTFCQLLRPGAHGFARCA